MRGRGRGSTGSAGAASAEVLAFQAAVRLWRWLQIPALPAAASVAERARHHLDHDGWADAAINDAATGVDDENLSAALRLVVESSLARRDTAERAFAAALAAATARDDGAADGELEDPAGTGLALESLLPRVVLPMARKAPVLLLVMDGMSAAAATEILDDATERLDWVEAALAGVLAPVRRPVGPPVADRGQPGVAAVRPADPRAAGRRTGRVCRAHRQVGEDQRGVVPQEGRRHDRPRRVGRRRRRCGPGRRGRIPLVTIVLNTIDDALDRSDAAGTRLDGRRGQAPGAAAGPGSRHRPDRGRHRRPRPRRRAANRHPTQLSRCHERSLAHAPPGRSGRTRSRSTAGGSWTSEGRAVLAVSEGLRYGPLKAGYHGGASAAEVVVPVAVLLPDEDTNPLRPGPAAAPAAALVVGRRRRRGRRRPLPRRTARHTTAVRQPGGRACPKREPTLFDAPTLPAAAPAGASLGQAVVGSEVFTDQRSLAARRRRRRRAGRLARRRVGGRGGWAAADCRRRPRSSA